jgi:hypothetical protein
MRSRTGCGPSASWRRLDIVCYPDARLRPAGSGETTVGGAVGATIGWLPIRHALARARVGVCHDARGRWNRLNRLVPPGSSEARRRQPWRPSGGCVQSWRPRWRRARRASTRPRRLATPPARHACRAPPVRPARAANADPADRLHAPPGQHRPGVRSRSRSLPSQRASTCARPPPRSKEAPLHEQAGRAARFG